MANNPKPDESWLAHQPTHLGLYWYIGGKKFSLGYDERDQFTLTPLVQAEGWPDGFGSDKPC
jgi:hypothetical protein